MVDQTFVVQDHQTCHVIVKMVKRAPILAEVSEDIGVSGHDGRGSHYRTRHQALPLHVVDGIGPESITPKSDMAKHNSRGYKSNYENRDRYQPL